MIDSFLRFTQELTGKVTLLSRLKLNDFRNLKSVELLFQPGFNLIIGPNGSGKTSLLEAIHVLSTGRSFRTTRLDPLISDGSANFVIFADTLADGVHYKIGLQRSANAAPLLRLNEQTQSSWSQVAACLPLQLVNSDSFSILEGGGKARRRFLDWALFHVEHSYLGDWRAYRRAITQRNILLKQKSSATAAQLDAWDSQIAVLGESIDQQRSALVNRFVPVLDQMLERLLPGVRIQFEYKRGWADDGELIQALRQFRDRDFRYGVTLNGPHRGDFVIKVNRHIATDALSRGQIKMLIFALKLAMGSVVKDTASHLSETENRSPLYLIDDLASELDPQNCQRIISYLHESGDQCIFTAITDTALSDVVDLTEASGKFHVEHGKILHSPAMV